MEIVISMWTLRFTSFPMHHERWRVDLKNKGCGGVAEDEVCICKRSTPPSAFPPWVVTSHERPVLVPADWEREGIRKNDENREKCVCERRRERERGRGRKIRAISPIYLTLILLDIIIIFCGVSFFPSSYVFRTYLTTTLGEGFIFSVFSPRLDSTASNPLSPLIAWDDRHPHFYLLFFSFSFFPPPE